VIIHLFLHKHHIALAARSAGLSCFYSTAVAAGGLLDSTLLSSITELTVMLRQVISTWKIAIILYTRCSCSSGKVLKLTWWSLDSFNVGILRILKTELWLNLTQFESMIMIELEFRSVWAHLDDCSCIPDAQAAWCMPRNSELNCSYCMVVLTRWEM
jgi:hypothetical protein